ncbi:MAG: hypothetical protein PHD48_11825 [Alphaproteobacteria bacterium]|nr:hypothetical protein [Alphaproteobacteria bacterium]
MTPYTETSVIPQVISLIGAEFDCKYLSHQRMANAIIHLTRKNGDCCPLDLLKVGFSEQETDERWHMAHAMAAVELRLMGQNFSRKFETGVYHG